MSDGGICGGMKCPLRGNVLDLFWVDGHAKMLIMSSLIIGKKLSWRFMC